jgi:hypothetical protein
MKKLAVAALILVASGRLLADTAQTLNTIDSNRERRQALEIRENALRLKHRNLEMLNKFFARTKYLRDNAIGGEAGVVKRSETWINGVKSWINQWDTLTEALKSINSNNVEDSANTIEKVVDDFYKKYAEHEAAAADINQKILNIHVELADLQILPLDVAPAYRAHVEAFNRHRDQIQQLNSTLERNFQSDRIQLLGEAATVFRSTVLTRIRQIVVQYPELEAIMEQTRLLMDMMDTYGSRIAAYEHSAVAARSALTFGSYFAAERNFNSVKALAAELQQGITDSKYGTRNASLYLNRIKTSLDATQAQWNAVMGLQTKHTMFYNFFTTQRRTLSADCRRRDMIPIRNCEMLRVLNQVQLDLPKVKAMSDGELKHLEENLIAVRKDRT